MMVLYSPDWTNTGFSFILLTVNLFRHSTLTEQGLYTLQNTETLFTNNNVTNEEGPFDFIYFMFYCSLRRAIVYMYVS